MVNRDRTGPLGKGPLTGRGLGSCREKLYIEDDLDFGKDLRIGRGLGMGRGLRRGFGWRTI